MSSLWNRLVVAPWICSTTNCGRSLRPGYHWHVLSLFLSIFTSTVSTLSIFNHLKLFALVCIVLLFSIPWVYIQSILVYSYACHFRFQVDIHITGPSYVTWDAWDSFDAFGGCDAYMMHMILSLRYQISASPGSCLWRARSFVLTWDIQTILWQRQSRQPIPLFPFSWSRQIAETFFISLVFRCMRSSMWAHCLRQWLVETVNLEQQVVFECGNGEAGPQGRAAVSLRSFCFCEKSIKPLSGQLPCKETWNTVLQKSIAISDLSSWFHKDI